MPISSLGDSLFGYVDAYHRCFRIRSGLFKAELYDTVCPFPAAGFLNAAAIIERLSIAIAGIVVLRNRFDTGNRFTERSCGYCSAIDSITFVISQMHFKRTVIVRK